MSSANALLPIHTSGSRSSRKQNTPSETGCLQPAELIPPLLPALPPGEADDLTTAMPAGDSADRVLLPEEAMNATFPQVAARLDEAMIALAAGQTDRACTHLADAAGLLDTLIAAVIPATAEEAAPTEAPRAMAAAA